MPVLEALPLTRYDWCVLLFGTVVIFTASVIQERSQRTIREILDEKCLALRWAVRLPASSPSCSWAFTAPACRHPNSCICSFKL